MHWTCAIKQNLNASGRKLSEIFRENAFASAQNETFTANVQFQQFMLGVVKRTHLWDYALISGTVMM